MTATVSAVRFYVGIGLLLLVGVGCQEGKGRVSGKVSYNGKPLALGSVTFKASDKNFHQGNIGLDGSYDVPGVSLGSALVAVNSSDPEVDYMGKRTLTEQEVSERTTQQAAEKARWFPIPEAYSDPKTSGLSFQVGKGRNQYDIDLK